MLHLFIFHDFRIINTSKFNNLNPNKWISKRSPRLKSFLYGLASVNKLTTNMILIQKRNLSQQHLLSLRKNALLSEKKKILTFTVRLMQMKIIVLSAKTKELWSAARIVQNHFTNPVFNWKKFLAATSNVPIVCQKPTKTAVFAKEFKILKNLPVSLSKSIARCATETFISLV